MAKKGGFVQFGGWRVYADWLPIFVIQKQVEISALRVFAALMQKAHLLPDALSGKRQGVACLQWVFAAWAVVFSDVLVDKFGQLCFGACAAQGGYGFAAFEHDQGGDVADAKAGRDFLVVVNADFGDLHFALIGAGEFFKNGGDGFAGAAPWSPEIDQYRGG